MHTISKFSVGIAKEGSKSKAGTELLVMLGQLDYQLDLIYIMKLLKMEKKLILKH